MATGAVLGGGLGFGVGGFGQAARELGQSALSRQARLNQIEDAIMALPEHERPVADLILREQGAEAAMRWIRQTMGGL